MTLTELPHLNPITSGIIKAAIEEQGGKVEIK